MKRLALFLLFAIHCSLFTSVAQTSVAGLFPLAQSGRVIYNFNDGWRFCLGDAENAQSTDFDDSRWEVVCAPHAVALEPAEASGGRNYQGVCWYRKTFTVPQDMAGKQLIVHFEAIMGKQQVWVNGKLVTTHEGGYLPVIVDLSQAGVKAGDSCVIAVRADNSDDKNYPPGKKQSQLDFAYHGGMYRDVWLIGRSPLHITDPLERQQVAGGGVFLHFDNISHKSADVFIDVEVGAADSHPARKSLTLTATIKDADGKTVKTVKQTKTVGSPTLFQLHSVLKAPQLWSPETPYLYHVELRLMDGRRCVDGGMVRMGIRKAEFRGRDGFWLNGEPYHQMVGGNRHQDFAYVGNALPNSQQWRDAKRLKDAGFTIVRSAHYPQDPAFMDACDEMGLFVIVPTPGWQFWNKDPEWAEKVHRNTRDIVRRDRNHPSVLMWEPILNETRFPKDFAINALQATREEYPWPGRPVAAADMNSQGVLDNYDVIYDWAYNIPKTASDDKDYAKGKCVFTREWGEYVDDWYAHNAINRAARPWGEHAMLQAALSLTDTYGQMFHGQRQFIGGCQWHPFDHQRGYHPDAYLGGIYDAFRQKKYAFEAFRSQVDGEPMLFIAQEMMPSSPADVTIFSNCDSVRLTALDGWKTETLPVVRDPQGIPHAPVVFKGFWDFWQARQLSYTKRNWQGVKFVAEGIKDGQVVCREEKMPSRRSTKLRLYADEMGKKLVADGSDFIVVVAEVTDDEGHVRRQAREWVTFTVEGEGTIIGDADIQANPRIVEWGSAPVLIRATRQAGPIRIIARPTFPGIHAPLADTLTIESVPAPEAIRHIPGGLTQQPLPDGRGVDGSSPEHSAHEATYSPHAREGQEGGPSATERRRMLEEVERQQQDFGTQEVK